MARLGRGRDVIIVIGADDKSGTALEKAKIRLKDIRTQTKKTDLSARSLRSSWFAATAAVTALAAAVTKLMAAYAEQERVEKRLKAVLRAKGLEVRATSQHLFEYASALQQTSTYGDEAIIPVQQLLMQLGELSGGMLDEATRLTLDFASAMGLDLRSAAVLMAKAAAGQVSALSRYGVTVDQNIPKTEKFAAVLEQLEKKFGGTAQSEVNTFAGQVSQLKNNFGDLAEEIGEMNSGVLTTAVRAWNRWAKAATDAIAQVNESADRSEAKLLEERVSRLKKELKGIVEHSVSLGEFVGDSPFIDRILPSSERMKEINRQIDSYTRRIEQLQTIAQAPQAAPPLITPEQFAASKRTALLGPLTFGLMQDEEGNIIVSDTFQSDMAIAMQKRTQLMIAAAQASSDLEMDAQEISLSQWQYFEETKTMISRQQAAMRVEAARGGLQALATLFPQVKAFAVSEALVSTYLGITKALGSAQPPLNFAQAALVAAQGFAAVKSIQSQGIRGGAGGTSSYSYGGATPTVPAGSTQAKTPVNVTIRLPAGSGQLYTEDDVAEILKTALPRAIKETGGQMEDVTLLYERNN